MRDLAKVLDDYVNGKLDPETEIEVDGLILQFVDGELDPERTAEIKAAMASNPAVEASISHSMRAAKTVQDELLPAYEAFKKQPNPTLDKALEDLLADPNAWGKEPKGEAPGGAVLPLKAPEKAEPPPAAPAAAMRPTWGAMAASIAALLAIGGGVYIYDAGHDAEIEQLAEDRAAESERLTQQVTALEVELNWATQARDDLTTRLAEAETVIQGLNAEQATVSAELAAARDGVTKAESERDSLKQEIVALDAETRQEIEARVSEREALARQLAATETRLEEATAERENATEALAESRTTIDALNADRTDLAKQLAAANDSITTAEAERDAREKQIVALDAEVSRTITARDMLTDQVSTLETRLATAEMARDGLEAQLIDARAAIDALDMEKATLASQVAELAVAGETAQAQLAAAAEESRERIAALEEELGEAQGDIVNLRQVGDMLVAENKRLLKEGSWIGQVVAYHRFYAGSPREVEGSDDKRLSEQALIKWFNTKLGRPFPVPNLEGLKYVGGRVYPINGAPTALIGYHDNLGRLIALCFSPAPGDQTTELGEGGDGDLNLVYWEKGGFRYALVGEAGPDLLKDLAGKLLKTYGEET